MFEFSLTVSAHTVTDTENWLHRGKLATQTITQVICAHISIGKFVQFFQWGLTFLIFLFGLCMIVFREDMSTIVLLEPW